MYVILYDNCIHTYKVHIQCKQLGCKSMCHLPQDKEHVYHVEILLAPHSLALQYFILTCRACQAALFSLNRHQAISAYPHSSWHLLLLRLGTELARGSRLCDREHAKPRALSPLPMPLCSAKRRLIEICLAMPIEWWQILLFIYGCLWLFMGLCAPSKVCLWLKLFSQPCFLLFFVCKWPKMVGGLLLLQAVRLSTIKVAKQTWNDSQKPWSQYIKIGKNWTTIDIQPIPTPLHFTTQSYMYISTYHFILYMLNYIILY